jgi:hypothetical protein
VAKIDKYDQVAVSLQPSKKAQYSNGILTSGVTNPCKLYQQPSPAPLLTDNNIDCSEGLSSYHPLCGIYSIYPIDGTYGTGCVAGCYHTDTNCCCSHDDMGIVIVRVMVVVIELIIGKETLLLIPLRKYQLILVVVVLQILSLILQIRRT